jgi:tRNA(Ile)-lysidine synthase
MRPVGRSARRDLKRLLQEYRIKPWLRDRTPLLFSQDELVAVGNALISAEHLAKPGEPSLKIVWESEIPD